MSPTRRPCGGCEGKGSHILWCPAVYGEVVGRLGAMSHEISAMGDNASPAQANILWNLAYMVKTAAQKVMYNQAKNDPSISIGEDDS